MNHRGMEQIGTHSIFPYGHIEKGQEEKNYQTR